MRNAGADPSGRPFGITSPLRLPSSERAPSNEPSECTAATRRRRQQRSDRRPSDDAVPRASTVGGWPHRPRRSGAATAYTEPGLDTSRQRLSCKAPAWVTTGGFCGPLESSLPIRRRSQVQEAGTERCSRADSVGHLWASRSAPAGVSHNARGCNRHRLRLCEDPRKNRQRLSGLRLDVSDGAYDSPIAGNR
jgi:hypothetical protein